MYCVFAFILFALCVGSSWQFCFHEYYPPGTKVCNLPDGTTMRGGLGFKLLTSRCLNCTCEGTPAFVVSMECCGYGINAGAFGPRPGCKVIAGADGCTPIEVLIADESVLC